jgi:hypothetical protein
VIGDPLMGQPAQQADAAEDFDVLMLETIDIHDEVPSPL